MRSFRSTLFTLAAAAVLAASALASATYDRAVDLYHRASQWVIQLIMPTAGTELRTGTVAPPERTPMLIVAKAFIDRLFKRDLTTVAERWRMCLSI